LLLSAEVQWLVQNSLRRPIEIAVEAHGEVETTARNMAELQPIVKQSFQEGCYSPSTGMEMSEWQIMLEQLIAMGVVIKEEDVNIDSD
jgi:hypothetical protein